MPSLTPSSDLVVRFRRDLAVLADDVGTVAVAVSGGPDSLALLLLAAAALPGRVAAATVDHGLRPESVFEALHVEDICERIGCPHSILTVTVPDGPSGLQAEARGARYTALANWAERQDIRYILTAHHADDQAETILMRLRRGAGISGLSGIRPLRSEGGTSIVRPLLGWTKAELVHLVASTGVEAIDDPGNRDPRFDRTAVRALLGETDAFDPITLARSASTLREADDALAWIVERLWNERVQTAGDGFGFDHDGLPVELKRRLLIRILAAFQPVPPRGDALGRLLKALEDDRTATLAGVKCRPGPIWQFVPAPPRRAT